MEVVLLHHWPSVVATPPTTCGSVESHRHSFQVAPRTVRSLIKEAESEGAGGNYLVQHPWFQDDAWFSHRLSQLWTTRTTVFNAIIVISDRKVFHSSTSARIDEFPLTLIVAAIDGTAAQLKEGTLSPPRVYCSIKQCLGKRFDQDRGERHRDYEDIIHDESGKQKSCPIQLRHAQVNLTFERFNRFAAIRCVRPLRKGSSSRALQSISRR